MSCAGLGSRRSISDLERGINRTAHKDTALLLAGALGLAEPVRTVFVAAARGKVPPAEVLAARDGGRPQAFAAMPTRALPRDIAADLVPAAPGGGQPAKVVAVQRGRFASRRRGCPVR